MRTTAQLLTFACFALLIPQAHAQEPIWLKHYGNGYSNKGLKMAYDGQAGLYGAGTLAPPSIEMDDTTLAVLGFMDIVIAKWDTTGTLLWARTIGADCSPSGLESVGSIAHDPNTNRVIVSGQFDCAETLFGSHVLYGTQNGGKDLFIASYDEFGECLWARSAVGFNTSYLHVLVDQNSTIHAFGLARIAGVTFQGTPAIYVPPGGFIAKYASDGSLLDAKRVVVNGELGPASWLTEDTWVLSGSVKPNGMLYNQPLYVQSMEHDGFVAKTDTTGVVEWATMFPSSGSASVFRSTVLADGRIAVFGYFVNDLIMPEDTLLGPPGVWSYFVAVLGANGNVNWVMPIAAEGPAAVSDIKADPNGDLLLYGRYEGVLPLGDYSLPPYSSTSAFVARFTPAGQCKAAWGFGRSYLASGSILPTEHGLYLSSEFDSTLVLGNSSVQSTYQGPEHRHDLFIARFDSLSGFTHVPSTTAVASEGLLIYANPNDGRSTIGVPSVIPAGSTVRLIVRNAHGQLVLEEPVVLDGRGTLQLDISTQAKGMYHVELLNEERRYTGKVVVE